MKDDRFMYSLRGEPRPEFARSLWRRLVAGADHAAAGAHADVDRIDESATVEVRRRVPLLPGFAAAAVALAVVALFVFPSVRASAQAFLDLFRVRSFTAVQFDPARLERFKGMEKEMSPFIFDRTGVSEPYLPSDVPSRSAAEAAAGIPVLEPGYIPDGLTREKLQTTQDARVRISASTEKLRAVIDALDLRDVDTPENLDGKWIDIHMYPSVLQRWGNDRLHVELVQARSPEVTLPPGLGDLARLGEIGLRILGLDRDEASRIARSVDWNSTLLVPVPMSASGFREVTVRGNKGLLVTTRGRSRDSAAKRNDDSAAKGNDDSAGRDGRVRDGGILLWTEGDRVFALSGNIESTQIMEIAESLR